MKREEQEGEGCYDSIHNMFGLNRKIMEIDACEHERATSCRLHQCINLYALEMHACTDNYCCGVYRVHNWQCENLQKTARKHVTINFTRTYVHVA